MAASDRITAQYLNPPPPEEAGHLPATTMSSQGVQDWGSPPPPTEAMGYPPTMGYPVGQSAYRELKAKESEAWDRIFFSYFLLILGSFFLVSLLLSEFTEWRELRASYPDFHIDSFSVSNFNPSYPGFSANWEVNITVENPHEDMKIYFHQIQAVVKKYTFVSYDNVFFTLSSGFSQPFTLEPNKSNVIHAKLSANDKDMDKLGTETIEETSYFTGTIFMSKSRLDELAKKNSRAVIDTLADERREGVVPLIFELNIWTTFHGLSKNSYTKHTTLRVKCDDIEVDFIGNTGYGKVPSLSQGCSTSDYNS